VIRDQWGKDDEGDTRTLVEVELLELGPVVFPAYPQTSVAVRAFARQLDDAGRAELSAELAADEVPAVVREPRTVDQNRASIREALAKFRQVHVE
jgi:hypothetical protein